MSNTRRREKDLMDCYSFRGDDFQEDSSRSFRRLPQDAPGYRRFAKRHTRRAARRYNEVLCQENS